MMQAIWYVRRHSSRRWRRGRRQGTPLTSLRRSHVHLRRATRPTSIQLSVVALIQNEREHALYPVRVPRIVFEKGFELPDCEFAQSRSVLVRRLGRARRLCTNPVGVARHQTVGPLLWKRHMQEREQLCVRGTGAENQSREQNIIPISS